MNCNNHVLMICRGYFTTLSDFKKRPELDVKIALIFASFFTLLIPLLFGVTYLFTSLINRINSEFEHDLSEIKNILTVKDVQTMDTSPGLNMVGICRNEACPNKDKLVSIPKGFKKNSEGLVEVNYIDEECCTTNCISCHQELNYDEVNEIIITEARFKLEAKTTRGTIDRYFQIRKNEFICIDLNDVTYLHVKLEPLLTTPFSKV